MLITSRLRHWLRSSIRNSATPRKYRDQRTPSVQLMGRRERNSIEFLEDRTLLAAALVGVDFGDDSLSKAPSSWTVVSGFTGSGLTVNDLVREDSTATTIDIFVDTADPNGTFRLDSVLDGATA